MKQFTENGLRKSDPLDIGHLAELSNSYITTNYPKHPLVPTTDNKEVQRRHSSTADELSAIFNSTTMSKQMQ